MAEAAERLRISEVFLSLQGEARDAGWPTVFVRLTGCPLRCRWCDTAYAFTGGEPMGLDAVLAAVDALATVHGERRVRHVCVTGGEPLAQRPSIELLRRLCEAGYSVSLETSGAMDIAGIDPRVSRVMDLKAPGSGEVARNRWENLELLTAHDQLKLVLAGRDDYDWAVSVIGKDDLTSRCDILFSAVHGQLEPRELADWIIADKLPVRFQVQLHKLLWADERGR